MRVHNVFALAIVAALILAAPSAASAVNVNCAPNGSVTLTNPNPNQLGSTLTAVPSHGVIEQSISGGAFVQKALNSPISWANNSIVNYRNTSNAASDSFSIGAYTF